MKKKPGSVMDIKELSAYLKIPKTTLYMLARAGRIPRQKIGRNWRFHKDAIDKWLSEEPDLVHKKKKNGVGIRRKDEQIPVEKKGQPGAVLTRSMEAAPTPSFLLVTPKD